MDVTLFIPCYVDQLAPEVGMASVRVLERAGCRVRYDPDLVCCGQPFLNAGMVHEAGRLAEICLDRLSGAEVVVCPSASCVATFRSGYGALDAATTPANLAVRSRIFELSEFLVSRLGRVELGARFPHRVVLLQSCHGLRELGLGPASEEPAAAEQDPGPTARLLAAVEGLDLRVPSRRDECCGFGGAFAVKFPEVSSRMGRERLRDLAETGAEYVTGTDVSCLLHLASIRSQLGRGPQTIHLAEILAAGLAS